MRHASAPRRRQVPAPASPAEAARLGAAYCGDSSAPAFLGYYYVQFSRIIEARLHGERDRVIPRVFARPLTLQHRPGHQRRPSWSRD